MDEGRSVSDSGGGFNVKDLCHTLGLGVDKGVGAKSSYQCPGMRLWKSGSAGRPDFMNWQVAATRSRRLQF